MRGQHACPHRLAPCANAPLWGLARVHEVTRGLQAAPSSGQHRAGRTASGGPSTGAGGTALADASPPAPAARTAAERPWPHPGKGSDHSHTSYGCSGSSAPRHTPPARLPLGRAGRQEDTAGKRPPAPRPPLWPERFRSRTEPPAHRGLNAVLQKEAQKRPAEHHRDCK